MRPKFQKRSELKLDGRIIPQVKLCGIICGMLPPALSFPCEWNETRESRKQM